MNPSQTAAPTCRFAEPAEKAGDTMVCHCKAVRESVVRSAVTNGATSVEEVAIKTGACTGCGACRCRVNRVLMGLPAKCGGRFDHCDHCGCSAVVCECVAA